MKKPSNKAIAIYLVWVLVHLTLWVIAKQHEYNTRFFYPFGMKDPYGNGLEYVRKPFTIDYVYDSSELLFYTIAPILIYYIITLFNSPKE
jgi:hypothetical protein